MKKLVSLLLCIALMLPVLALAEGAAEWVTLDYEDFSMQVKSTDILQQGEKSNGSVLFTLYPDYADADVFHSNINCAWISNDLTGLGGMSARAYAQMVLDAAKQQFSAQNIACQNEQIISYELSEDGTELSLLFSYDLDYSAAGHNLQTTLYQLQLYAMLGDKGTYMFTFSATDMATLENMLVYAQTVELK